MVEALLLIGASLLVSFLCLLPYNKSNYRIIASKLFVSFALEQIKTTMCCFKKKKRNDDHHLRFNINILFTLQNIAKKK
jgi:hypothetical protein